jgi:hypothetical protein
MPPERPTVGRGFGGELPPSHTSGEPGAKPPIPARYPAGVARRGGRAAISARYRGRAARTAAPGGAATGERAR